VLLATVVHVSPSNSVAYHLHTRYGIDDNRKFFADTEHVGIEAEVGFTDVQPAEEDDSGGEARAAIVLVNSFGFELEKLADDLS